MDIRLYIPIIFMVAITIHNIEEAIWLPNWSKHAKQYYKPVEGKIFRFAVTIITLFAYAVSIAVLFIGYNSVVSYMMFGFMGAMMLNAIFPHLVMTILLKRYAPGLATGLIINIPLFLILLIHAVKLKMIFLLTLIISTGLMAILLLGILPILFKLARFLMTDKEK